MTPTLSLDALVDRAARVASESASHAAEVDTDEGFPAADIELLADAGLLIAPLGTRHGGLGLGTMWGTTAPLLTILRCIGRGNLSVGRLYEGHVNALQLVHQYGREDVIDQFVQAVHERRLFGVWNTDDFVTDTGVSITERDGTFVLVGTKAFASGAGHLSRAVVTATWPDGGRQMCLVATDQPAVTVIRGSWQPLGMRSSASSRIVFDNVVLSKSALIGAVDDYIREPIFRAGALRFAAVQVGGIEALLDACRSYVRQERRQHDPYVQQRVASAALEVEACNLWLSAGAAHYENVLARGPEFSLALETAEQQLVAYANMVRSAVERASLNVLELVERTVGARGLLRPYSMERLIRDLRMYLRQPAIDATLAHVGQYVLDSESPVAGLWDMRS